MNAQLFWGLPQLVSTCARKKQMAGRTSMHPSASLQRLYILAAVEGHDVVCEGCKGISLEDVRLVGNGSSPPQAHSYEMNCTTLAKYPQVGGCIPEQPFTVRGAT